MKYRDIKDVWIGKELSNKFLEIVNVFFSAMLTSNSLDTTVPTQDFALRLNSGEVPVSINV